MQPLTLDRRVTNLEQKVGKLEELPDRVTALGVQFSEFRTEVRAEFSATRAELRQEMRALHDATNANLDQKIDETRAEMRALNVETNAQMRALHEDVIDRLTKISEGGEPPTVRRKRSR